MKIALVGASCNAVRSGMFLRLQEPSLTFSTLSGLAVP
jgi:hypothetical protein